MATAMVIDDSRAIRMILTRTLKKLGYDVCSAADGGEALTILADQRPDLSLFLVDWNMPNVDGLEFTRRVRQLSTYSSVPLMMVTTETEIDQMIRALDAGANEYLMKPFTDEMIVDKLRLLGLPVVSE